MKQKITVNTVYIIMLMVIIFTSCSDGMYDYKKFAQGGEITYTGKIDSVDVHAGLERVYITGLFMSDPKITGCRVYWNNHRDSVDIPVVRTSDVDTLKHFLPLPEGLYNFQLRTYDALGNKSVPVDVIGRSYGSDYKSSISNRLISSSIVNGNDLNISWRNIDKTLGPIATEVTYTNTTDQTCVEIIDIKEVQSTIHNCKPGTKFSYRTLYLPEELCVDTVKTNSNIVSPPYKIDKSAWSVTTNTYEVSDGPNGGPATYVLDNNEETYWHTRYSSDVVVRPHWLEIDMAQEVKVVIVELVPRQNNAWANFTDFKIQGRNSADDPWSDYGAFTLEGVSDVQRFTISGAPTMKYIKLVVISGRSDHTALAEFSVYGSIVE